jgi:hypothetical protein
MITEDDVRGVVSAHLPTYRIESVATLGAGQDNVAFEVNNDLVVRFRLDPEADVARDARLRELHQKQPRATSLGPQRPRHGGIKPGTIRGPIACNACKT